MSVRGKVTELCEVEKGPCLGHYLAAEQLIRELLTDNQELLQRYRHLYSYPHFGETATPGIAEPLAGYPTRLSPLVSAEIALAIQHGDMTAALDRLEQDLSFWRRLLRESKALVSKMVAMGAIFRDYHLLSEIINFDERMTGQQRERIEKLVVLLDRGEGGIAECMRREFAMAVRTLRSLPEPGEAYLKLGYQPNATINDAYRVFKTYSDLAEMPAGQFAAANTSAGNALRDIFDVKSAGWRLVYNPFGRILGSGPPNFSAYIAAGHDLDGYLRLVALQLQIRKLGLADARITEFLRTADKRYANPYTGQPMQWDPTQRALFFNGLSERFSSDGVVRASLGS